MPIQAPQWTEFLTCPVCCNLFDDVPHRPISLGCGHTVCKTCLSKLHPKKCPFDQSNITRPIDELPSNYALLNLVGVVVSDMEQENLPDLEENCKFYKSARQCIEHLATYLKSLSNEIIEQRNAAGDTTKDMKLGQFASTIVSNSTSSLLSRSMQRKLVTLLNCQLIEEEGRVRAMRAARSLGERTVTELILQHQNSQQLSANLWSAVRARGCQFLGPAMQEEVIRLILLALEDGRPLSRKVLVLFVVQRLEMQYPQASKTAIGHVVQLLYRASCFKVTKRDEESSLMQLKEEFQAYDALRREHDFQIIQIATEAGLRIAPDQWSSLLYGDTDHKSQTQSIIDKLQAPESFSQSVTYLMIILPRTGDPAKLARLRPHLDLLSNINPSSDAPSPSWENLDAVMKAVKTVVHGLVNFIQAHSTKKQDTGSQQTMKYKTSMCRDLTQKSVCPRGSNCSFAHSQEEMEKYRAKNKKLGTKPAKVIGLSKDSKLTPKERDELESVTRSTQDRLQQMSATESRSKSPGVPFLKPVDDAMAFTRLDAAPYVEPPVLPSGVLPPSGVVIAGAQPLRGPPPYPVAQQETEYVQGYAHPSHGRYMAYDVPPYMTASAVEGSYYVLPPSAPYPRAALPGQYPMSYRALDPGAGTGAYPRMPYQPHDPGGSYMQYHPNDRYTRMKTYPVPQYYPDDPTGYVHDVGQMTNPTGYMPRCPDEIPQAISQHTSVLARGSAHSVEDLKQRKDEIIAKLQKKGPALPSPAPMSPPEGHHPPSTELLNVHVRTSGVSDTMMSYKSTNSLPHISKKRAVSPLPILTSVADSRAISQTMSALPKTFLLNSTRSESVYLPWSVDSTLTTKMVDSSRASGKEASPERDSQHDDGSDLEDGLLEKIHKPISESDEAYTESSTPASTEVVDLIPFDPPFVSKYGPISRTARAKFKTTAPVQAVADALVKIVTPVTAVTPMTRPLSVSYQAPSRFNSISNTLRPDAEPFIASGTREPHALWSLRERQCMLEMALLDQHRRFMESGPIELNEDQRLAYELQFIEIQLSMQSRSTPQGPSESLYHQGKKEKSSNDKIEGVTPQESEQQVDTNRIYAEQIAMEEIHQKERNEQKGES